jgi:hypothetical protein
MLAKKKLTLSIARELNQRLDFEAALKGKGTDRSSLVDALLNERICLPADWTDFAVTSPETPCPPEAKPSRKPGDSDATREKTTFYISGKAAMLLSLWASLTQTDRSAVVEGLIRDHVTPWQAYDPRTHHTAAYRRSSGRVVTEDRRDHADEVSQATQEAA